MNADAAEPGMFADAFVVAKVAVVAVVEQESVQEVQSHVTLVQVERLESTDWRHVVGSYVSEQDYVIVFGAHAGFDLSGLPLHLSTVVNAAGAAAAVVAVAAAAAAVVVEPAALASPLQH